MKAQVHFNAFGQILSVSEKHDGTEEHPPAGVLLPPEYRTLEADVETSRGSSSTRRTE